jgi:zinc and cadmium transporter
VLAAGVLTFTVLSAWVPRMVSYAVGAMLAVAFLHLLPEAFSQAGSVEGLFAATLGGVLAFFLLEKATLWRHRHGNGAAAHAGHEHPGRRSAGLLIVIGDGFHNFVDGVLIAAAFLTDTHLGITATLAIIAHEIPQEIGDFMVLLNSGYSRRTALVLNVLSSLTSLAGGVLGFYALEGMRSATPYVLVVAAASFIYIAVADLIPDLHRAHGTRETLWQITLVATGVATMAVLRAALHSH